MNTTFSYCVLKYRHSILLNEILNVGLLFYFPNEKRIYFSYPSRLNRISHLYENINIGTIKSVQLIFTNQCSILNKEWDFDANSLFKNVVDFERPFKSIIHDYFLVEDASSLYFEEVKTGVNIGVKEIISYYEKEYFSCYEDTIHNPNKKDEKYIEHKLKTNLRNSLRNNSFNINDIEIDKNIKAGLISERFKYGWKNGGDKLITLIGFDLLEADTIKNKALSWYGKFSFLKQFANDRDINFHILTSKPSKKGLLSAYHDAINIIKQSDAPTEFYADNQIEEYSDIISKNITGKVSSI
jgi:hypothetical protein